MPFYASFTVILHFQFERIDASLVESTQRESGLLHEIRELEIKYVDLKQIMDHNNKKESQFQQELVDADKDADKMSSKESIYLEKQVKIKNIGKKNAIKISQKIF